MSREPDGFVGSTPHGRPLLVRTEESAQSWIGVGATMEPVYRRTPEDVATLRDAIRVADRLCEGYDNYAGVDVKELAAKLRAMKGDA